MDRSALLIMQLLGLVSIHQSTLILMDLEEITRGLYED